MNRETCEHSTPADLPCNKCRVANRGGHLAVAMSRIADLEAQRDALLEALKMLAEIIDKMGDMPDGFIHPSPWQTLKCEETLKQARAAIKAAEGEKR